MRFGVVTGFGATWTGEAIVRLAQRVEALGFESLWVPDHVVVPAGHRSRYPYGARTDRLDPSTSLPDPLVLLGFAAAVTSRLVLATGCLVAPHRHPTVLAGEVAALDRAAPGRVVAGLGLGWIREEAEAVGRPWSERVARTEAAVAAVRAAAPAVPVVIAGPSGAAAARAGRLADGWLSNHRDRTVLADRIATLRRAATEVGRDPAAVEVTVGAAPDRRAVADLASVGVTRVLWIVPLTDEARVGRTLERLAGVGRGVRG